MNQLDKNTRLFSADCAERVLHIFEDRFPGDKRPRLAIQAARDFAYDKITATVADDASAACYGSFYDVCNLVRHPSDPAALAAHSAACAADTQKDKVLASPNLAILAACRAAVKVYGDSVIVASITAANEQEEQEKIFNKYFGEGKHK